MIRTWQTFFYSNQFVSEILAKGLRRSWISSKKQKKKRAIAYACIFIMHLFIIYHVHSRSWNISPPSKVYHTRLRSRMENEERAHLESHYQNELESVKNEVARMTNLLEQLLKAKNREGTSTQPIIGAPAAYIQGTSQNVGLFNSKTTFCAYSPYPAKLSSRHREFNSR